MPRKPKSQRVSRQEKQRKDYFKNMLLAVIKSFFLLPLAAWLLTAFVIGRMELHYIGPESTLYEVEGVCTEVRYEIRGRYRIRTQYDAVVLTINGADYSLVDETATHVVYNSANNFEELKKQWTGKELYIQYTHEEERNVAALHAADNQTVYLTLEESAEIYRSDWVGFAWLFGGFFIFIASGCCVYFWATKPDSPYFMQKRKEKIKESIKSE